MEINNGQQILVSSSSSGAVTIIDIDTNQVIFYTKVLNGHSVELLPYNKLFAASSVSDDGNKIMLFDITQLNSKPLFTDTRPSAHGVVGYKKRNSLYTLGYNVSQEYKMPSSNILLKKNQWTIQGIDGDDLQMVSDDGNALFLPEQNGA